MCASQDSALDVLRRRQFATDIATLHLQFPTQLRRCVLPGPFHAGANDALVRACSLGSVVELECVLDEHHASLDPNYRLHRALLAAVFFGTQDVAEAMATLLLDRLGDRLDLIGFQPVRASAGGHRPPG